VVLVVYSSQGWAGSLNRSGSDALAGNCDLVLLALQSKNSGVADISKYFLLRFEFSAAPDVNRYTAKLNTRVHERN
jgi:hypothetical protein